MSNSTTLILVMGVSGSGKTTLARTLSEQLHWTYLEADDFHSKTAIEKMRSGIPLNDNDREPWIGRIQLSLRELSAAGKSCILACSGLRRSHRACLMGSGFEITRAFLLDADYHALEERLKNRPGHYMPASLLQSQLDTLEAPLPAENIDRLNTSNRDANSLAEIIYRQLSD